MQYYWLQGITGEAEQDHSQNPSRQSPHYLIHHLPGNQ